MISFTCPGCQSTFKLADELAGKTARCSKCSERFTVPGGQPKAAPALAPVAARKVALNPVPEILEAEIVDEPAPLPQVRSGRAKAIDEVEVVEEEAIQEPRPGRRAPTRSVRDDDGDQPSRRRDDDGDDDDFDRPRRKKKKRRSAGSMGLIMASIGGGSALLAGLMFILAAATSGPAVVRNVPIQFNNPPNVQPNQPNQPNQQPNQPQQNPAVPGAQQIQLVNGRFQTQDRVALNDPQDPRRAGFHARRYAVQLEAGKSYSIEMDAVGAGAFFFDPYLRVESQDGGFVEEDDDSGVGELDARIVFLAQKGGTYIITATTFAPRMQGNYRLTIRTPP